MQLAIIQQESRFRYNAKAPKDYLFGFIPWGRQSSAYGYAQIMKGTWNWHKKKTGNRRAHRENFADVVDFTGWYSSMSHTTLGISKWDALNQYLAYTEVTTFQFATKCHDSLVSNCVLNFGVNGNQKIWRGQLSTLNGQYLGNQQNGGRVRIAVNATPDASPSYWVRGTVTLTSDPVNPQLANRGIICRPGRAYFGEQRGRYFQAIPLSFLDPETSDPS